MSSSLARSGRRQSLAIISLSLLLVLLPCPFAAQRAFGQNQPDQFLADAQLSFARAAVYGHGVLIEWNNRFDPNNLGFNVYRVTGGNRTLLNGQVIGGEVFLR